MNKKLFVLLFVLFVPITIYFIMVTAITQSSDVNASGNISAADFAPSPKNRVEMVFSPPIVAFKNTSTFDCYVIYGYSMTPAISNGSTVCTIIVSYDEVVVGDIVTVYDDSTEVLIIHQIVQKTDKTFRTKAFSNPYILDSTIWQKSQYRGVVIAIFY